MKWHDVDLILKDALPQDVVVGAEDGMVVYVEPEQRRWEHSARYGWRPIEPTDEELRTAHKRATYVQAALEKYREAYLSDPTPLYLDTLVATACERIPGVVRPFQPTQFGGNDSQ